MPFRRENLHLIHLTITAKLLRSRILRPILTHDAVLLSAFDHTTVNLVNIRSIRDSATGDGRHETTRTNHIGNRGRVKNPTIRIQILWNSRAPVTRHPRGHTLIDDHVTVKQIVKSLPFDIIELVEQMSAAYFVGIDIIEEMPRVKRFALHQSPQILLTPTNTVPIGPFPSS